MIKLGFDEVEVAAGGGEEVLELGAFEFVVGGAVDFFEDAARSDFIADGDFVTFAEFVPGFVPNPEVFTVFKKFALVAGGNGAEDSAAEFGFEVDFVLKGASVARVV